MKIMSNNDIPLYSDTPEDFNASLPPQMRFLLTNYKYLVKNDHDYDNLD